MKIAIKNSFITRKDCELLGFNLSHKIAVANGDINVFKFMKKYDGQELIIDDKTLKILPPNSIRFIRSLFC